MSLHRILLTAVATIVLSGCALLELDEGNEGVLVPVEDGDGPDLQIDLVEEFWAEVADEIGHDYEQVAADRLIPRSALLDGSNAGICSWNGDEEELDPDDVADNAFVTTCDEGITVVWDDVDYVPQLDKKYGTAGPAMLMAHEWGHVVQFQLGLDDQPGILAEQQADCWSGAYARWAEDRGIAPFTDPTALDLAIISTLETRDEAGTDPENGDSHGNGFDRVRATQEGYENGVAFCKAYDDEEPPVTQIAFVDDEDEASGGNLPFDEAEELLRDEVADHFESLTSESLAVDEPTTDELRDLHSSIGDNAVGTEYALRWAEALQEAEGLDIDGRDAALQRACLVGTWLNEVLNTDDPVAGQLSPHDLDEAIQTFSTSDDLLRNPGLVFDMVAELRTGTLDRRRLVPALTSRA